MAERAKAEILIVDDSKMMVTMTRQILERNFAVTAVGSGEECLRLVKNYTPQLILLDIIMPGMDGFAVLHELKANEETSHIPVIFLTGDEHSESEYHGLQEGAVDFINKQYINTPSGKAVLLQRVRNTIDLSQLRQDLQKKVDEQTEKAQQLTVEIMQTLSGTVDAKDHYTRGHSARVARYAKEIARRLGKSKQIQEDVYAMGLLHDIGKIGVAGSIIRKNSKLDAGEYEEIKEHTIWGYEILKNIKSLPSLAIGARSHHERYDGAGYPDGLKGTQIPEEVRILTVADVYDALSSKRSYSQIRSQAAVRKEFEAGKGTHFDPIIADVMLRMIDEDKDYQMKEQ
ncbi:MAG: response regulator [Treponema sp.]|nr:response regulator [Treponema sp.]